MSIDGRSVVLVDEHPLWLDAVERVLAGVSLEVVGKATSYAEASELIDELRPDLVVAEIAISDGETSGVAWLAELRERRPELRVIVLATSSDAAQISAALAAGADAYVVKKAHPDDLAVAVRQVYEHSIYLPRSPADERAPSPERLEHFDLTKRELEILRLVAEGMSNAQLAKQLWVTEQTVKFHLSNIYRKLNVSNRTEASRWAQLHGLLAPEPITAGTPSGAGFGAR